MLTTKDIELFPSNLAEINRKKRQIKAEIVSQNLFGQTPREILRKEKIKPGKFVNIPLDDKIEKDKATLFEIEYHTLPSVKEKKKLESLLIKEISKNDVGLDLNQQPKLHVKLILNKLEENDEKVKDDLNKKILEKFGNYAKGKKRLHKKTPKLRKKIKRKITAKGRASKINYYISRIICPICFEKIGNKDNRIITPSRHIFHKNCLDEWCELNKRMNPLYSCTCPICRKELPNEDDNEYNEYNEYNENDENIDPYNTIPQTQDSLVDERRTENTLVNEIVNYMTRIFREQNRLPDNNTTQISPPNQLNMREETQISPPNQLNMREEMIQLQQLLEDANLDPSNVRIPGFRFRREPPSPPPSPNNGDPGSDGETAGKKTRKRKRRKRRIN